MKRLMVVVLAGLFLAGCGNSTYDKAMEQAKLALANGEYDKALASFELALEEKPKDKEAKAAYDELMALQQVKEDMESSKWDEVLANAEALLNQEGVSNSIQKKMEEYINTAKAHKEQYKLVSEEVDKIKGLIGKENYPDAQKMIAVLKDNPDNQKVLNGFAEEVDKMEAAIDEGILKQKEEKEAEEKRKAEAAAAAKQKQEAAWTTYSNPRFGFQVNYPQGWTLGPEPTNGDGRALYQGDGAEITASASYLMPETQPDLTNYEKLQTNHGESAYLRVKNDGSAVTFDGYIMNDEIVFHLYGLMDPAFYQEYSDVLRQMLLSAKLH